MRCQRNSPVSLLFHSNFRATDSKDCAGPQRPQGDATFLCSSARLIRTSPVFRLSLESPDFELQTVPGKVRPEVAVGFDEYALWHVLSMIHLEQTFRAARNVWAWRDRSNDTHKTSFSRGQFYPLDDLAQVAMVLHHYQCVDALRWAMTVWRCDLARVVSWRNGELTMRARNHEAAIFTAWVFGSTVSLRDATERAALRLTGPLWAGTFPIPPTIIGKYPRFPFQT